MRYENFNLAICLIQNTTLGNINYQILHGFVECVSNPITYSILDPLILIKRQIHISQDQMIERQAKHADQACITLAAMECTALEDKKDESGFHATRR